MLTAEPLLFRKEPLQTSQSFGVRTAKCLTTPAQEKKAQINVVARVDVASGPPRAPPAQEMLPAGAQSHAGMQQQVLHGREEDVHECALVPWD